MDEQTEYERRCLEELDFTDSPLDSCASLDVNDEQVCLEEEVTTYHAITTNPTFSAPQSPSPTSPGTSQTQAPKRSRKLGMRCFRKRHGNRTEVSRSRRDISESKVEQPLNCQNHLQSSSITDDDTTPSNFSLDRSDKTSSGSSTISSTRTAESQPRPARNYNRPSNPRFLNKSSKKREVIAKSLDNTIPEVPGPAPKLPTLQIGGTIFDSIDATRSVVGKGNTRGSINVDLQAFPSLKGLQDSLAATLGTLGIEARSLHQYPEAVQSCLQDAFPPAKAKCNEARQPGGYSNKNPHDTNQSFTKKSPGTKQRLPGKPLDLTGSSSQSLSLLGSIASSRGNEVLHRPPLLSARQSDDINPPPQELIDHPSSTPSISSFDRGQDQEAASPTTRLKQHTQTEKLSISSSGSSIYSKSTTAKSRTSSSQQPAISDKITQSTRAPSLSAQCGVTTPTPDASTLKAPSPNPKQPPSSFADLDLTELENQLYKDAMPYSLPIAMPPNFLVSTSDIARRNEGGDSSPVRCSTSSTLSGTTLVEPDTTHHSRTRKHRYGICFM